MSMYFELPTGIYWQYSIMIVIEQRTMIVLSRSGLIILYIHRICISMRDVIEISFHDGDTNYIHGCPENVPPSEAQLSELSQIESHPPT